MIRTIYTTDTSCALLMKLLLAECFQLVLRVPARFEQNTRFSEVLMSNLIGMIHGAHMDTWTRRTSQGAPDWPSFLALVPLATPLAPISPKTSRDCFSLSASLCSVKPRHESRACRAAHGHTARGDSPLPPPGTHAFAQMAPQWLQPSQDRLSPT